MTTIKAIFGLLVAVVAAAVLGSSAAYAKAEGWAEVSAQTQLRADGARARPIGRCTMAEPVTRSSIEVQIAYVADFCELVSQALASNVFRAPVIVTPGLWHYPDATVSCRLRYRQTRYRMTISNSAASCRWLTRVAVGWHRVPALPDSAEGLQLVPPSA